MATGGVVTDEPPEITWTAGWGADVSVGDLIKVAKLGGPVRVKSLRKWLAPPGSDKRGPMMEEEAEERPWYYGAVVEDRLGGQFHVYIQPHEGVFLAPNVPEHIEIPEGDSGSDE